jgi:hypothetical protein
MGLRQVATVVQWNSRNGMSSSCWRGAWFGDVWAFSDSPRAPSPSPSPVAELTALGRADRLRSHVDLALDTGRHLGGLRQRTDVGPALLTAYRALLRAQSAGYKDRKLSRITL